VHKHGTAGIPYPPLSRDGSFEKYAGARSRSLGHRRSPERELSNRSQPIPVLERNFGQHHWSIRNAQRNEAWVSAANWAFECRRTHPTPRQPLAGIILESVTDVAADVETTASHVAIWT
jgi:hypothetical protein